MKKSELFELRKYVGNTDAVYGVKDYVFNDGPAKGVRAFDVKNGKGLELTVLADRGLDIPFLSFKGVTMNFAGKPGIHAPAFFVEDGVRGYLTRFNAGMLTTCGITYSGAPCEDEGRTLGLHGPYDNTPASYVSAAQACQGDDIVIRIAGEVKEACVFNENMRLTRELTVETEKNVVHIKDTVENLGFDDQPLMLVYHINFGHPMLDAGGKVYVSAKKCVARDDFAAAGMDTHLVMEAPEIGRDEQCYFHTQCPEKEGFAMLHNEKLGMAGIVTYDSEALPLLCQWKCMRAGDYALGLEPTAAGVLGRAAARAEGTLPFLKPGQTKEFNVSLTFTDDTKLIEAYKDKAK